MKKLRIAAIFVAALNVALIWFGLGFQLARHQAFQGTTANVYVAIVVALTLLALTLSMISLRRERKRFDNPS